jgi:hypothetical protein
MAEVRPPSPRVQWQLVVAQAARLVQVAKEAMVLALAEAALAFLAMAQMVAGGKTNGLALAAALPRILQAGSVGPVPSQPAGLAEAAAAQP